MKKGEMHWETVAKLILMVIIIIIIVVLTYAFRDRMYEIVDKLKGIF
tara:strand:+ start:96414 stop:96554 length:141 start_codon:yes stop_codon:yes gene_type:complete